MESTRICCLKRLGGKSIEHKIISLHDEDEVIIGRALDVTVSIPSPLISRHHATLKKEQDQDSWTILDNKSLNGILVNGNKLKPNVPCKLKDGDIIQLGVPPPTCPKSKEPSQFLWTFHKQLKVKILGSHVTGQSDTNLQSDSQHSESEHGEIKDENSPQEGPSGSRYRPPLKRLHPDHYPSSSKKRSPSSELKKKLQEQERIVEEKLRKHEEQLAQMAAKLAEKEQTEEKMRQELERKETEMKVEMKKQQEQMEMEKEKIKLKIKQEYEEQLKSKEELLLEKMDSDRRKLIDERLRLEENLKEEVEQRTETLREKEKLDKIIAQKESGMKMLQQQLDDVKTENVQHQEKALLAKEDILSNFAELMETELQCSICNELFVQATSLNCSHSYCAYCIEQWMDVKKECPVCRAPITSHLRSIVLDTYIDRMVENLNDEMKERRKLLVQERKEEMEKRKAAQEDAATSAGTRGGRRRRGRGRAGSPRASPRRPGTRSQQPVSPAGNRRSRPMVIEDSPEEDSESDLDDSSDTSVNDSSSVEGEEGYYGGYGRCYNCGRRGHWANGCPY